MHIPSELSNFCSSPGRILLIKGEPGTGKTLLSLELLDCCSEERHKFYLSTRVTPERLLAENPRLKERFDVKGVFDRVKMEEAVTAVYDLTKGDLSGFVDQLYRLTDQAVEPFIVVDSWSGVALTLGPEERLKGEQSLVNLCQETDAFVVFVSEETEPSNIDFLVDGVVELEQSEMENRPLRYMYLHKLRGTRIDHRRYVFTLLDGRFKAFPPFEMPEGWATAKKRNVKEREGYFSTGMEDLDVPLGGGFPEGSTVLLEVGADVPGISVRAIQYSIASNAIGHGRGVIVIPTLGYHHEEAITLAKQVFGKSSEGLLRFVGVRRQEEESDLSVPLSLRSAEEDYRDWESVYDGLLEETGRPILLITGMDRQWTRYGTEEYRRTVGYSVDKMRDTGSVEVRISKPGMEDVTQMASGLSDIHLEMASAEGSALLFGRTPWTGLYVLEPVLDEGFISLRLIPVV